jgi:hypothetical protein
MAKKSKMLLTAALGLGVGLTWTGMVDAQGHLFRKGGHGGGYPVYGSGAPCPQGPIVMPYQPAAPGALPAPSGPTAPAAPGTVPTTPPGTAPTTPTPPAPAPEAAPGGDLFGAADTTSGTALAANMAGRADSSNRFNLFDSQSAIPQSRVWFSYQKVGGFTTGLEPIPNGLSGFVSSSTSSSTFLSDNGINPTLIDRQDTTLYRFGAEFAFSPKASVAFQAQYYTSDAEGGVDDWVNPQFLFKYVLCENNGTVVSAILGIQPQHSTEAGAFNDDTTALYPGMLFLNASDSLLLQGGFQVRIPWGGNQVYTFDWALSAGYWLYRDPSTLHNGGWANCGSCCGGGKGGWIRGILPQVEIYGKHVIGDATITDPFDFPAGVQIFDSSTGTFSLLRFPFTYEEPRHVFDLTLGTQVILNHGVTLAAGYSFPISGNSVRDDEWIFTISFGF